METIKIKLKSSPATALQNYMEECARECRHSKELPDFIKITYWIVNDLRDQINRKLSKSQITYTINFKPQEAYIFLKLQGMSYDPYEKNVIRQIRADLDKQSI